MDQSVSFNQVSYVYQPNTPFAFTALEGLDLTIRAGELLAIVGHTGSGKSTLIQQINGLLLPSTGSVTVLGNRLAAGVDHQVVSRVRKSVGFVFQQPEKQLFEETVAKDICFGPRNFGVAEEQLPEIAAAAMKQVGLSETLLERSPFELSGGQMRRVAIAGVLAMHPDILILDEPTAGLDPKGQAEIMAVVDDLRKNDAVTVVLVTHQMDIVAEHAQRVLVMNAGQRCFEGTPRELFQDTALLKRMNLAVPETVALANRLSEAGVRLERLPITSDELSRELLQTVDFRAEGHHE